MSPELARLRWRSRRGMRELDALLSAFVERVLATLDEDEMREYDQLLQLPDPVLHDYLVGRDEPDDPAQRRLVERIRGSLAD